MEDLKNMYIAALESLKGRVVTNQVTYEQAEEELKFIQSLYSLSIVAGNEDEDI